MERVRKNALIARKQGAWQGYLTCEKAEKGREISDRIGAKGSTKKGQKRRELTSALTGFNVTKPRMALYELFANGDPTVTNMIKAQKQQSPVVSESG
ncbi:hypothetical protein ACYZTX_12480 [Pseudomonas sp. MDT1-17]